MTSRECITRILDELAFPHTQYMVNGSGAMILQGITEKERGRPVGDLDIFCATRLWFDLLDKGVWQLVTPNPDDPNRRCDPPMLRAFMYGLEVNVLSTWRWRTSGNFDVNGLIRNAILVDGRYSCAHLNFILAWKRETRRKKDIEDVEVIEYFKEAHNNADN